MPPTTTSHIAATVKNNIEVTAATKAIFFDLPFSELSVKTVSVKKTKVINSDVIRNALGSHSSSGREKGIAFPVKAFLMGCAS
ncbi:hypothetical protein D3C87_1502430 [compost metagenome]